MAVPVAIAGAGIAARGFASWLAKKKATEAGAKAAVRSTGAASIPNLVSGSRVSKGGLGGYQARLGAGTAGIGAASVMTQQPNGGDLNPRIEAMERLRNPRVGMTGLGGGYMANPMMDYRSRDPSYDASMTREGQIQTMMEEMDGMGLSEDAKKRIIEDKLGPDFTAKDYHIMQEGMDYPVSDEEVPMTIDKLRGMARKASGVGYTENEKAEYLKRIQAIEAKDKADYLRRNTGASMTPNEIRMFMGRPVQTSGYDRGPIRPRFDEFGNLIPQRPTMMV